MLLLCSSAIETLKDFNMLLLRNTDTLISHTDRYRFCGCTDVNLYRICSRRIFDRIADQIQEYLWSFKDVSGVLSS